MTMRKCRHCGNECHRRDAVYCSYECFLAEHQAEVICRKCGKRFTTKANYIRRGRMKYCSRECSIAATQTYPKIELQGKLYTLRPSGYYEARRPRKLMHHAVWESVNGLVPKGYLVHHKDGDKGNNDLSNLELMEWGKHTALHNAVGVEMGTVVCMFCGNSVARFARDIRRGQDKFCSLACANKARKRRSDGTFDAARTRT